MFETKASIIQVGDKFAVRVKKWYWINAGFLGHYNYFFNMEGINKCCILETMEKAEERLDSWKILGKL